MQRANPDCDVAATLNVCTSKRANERGALTDLLMREVTGTLTSASQVGFSAKYSLAFMSTVNCKSSVRGDWLASECVCLDGSPWTIALMHSKCSFQEVSDNKRSSDTKGVR